MLKDITLGQYYPADSVIHRLDPRVKLFATLIFIISLFCFKGPLGFALILVFMGVFIKMSKVPLSYMLRGLRAIVILLFIAGAFNLFLSPGEALVSLGPLTVTDTGLRNAVLMTVRMVFLIVGTSVMTLTTTPNQLTDGMEKALRPLNKIHVPVHEISMMMSIALRFIPLLIEETDKIMKAQMARGADFESGNLLKKAKNMVPPSGAVVCLGFSSGERSGAGYGGPLLQWRRWPHEDEAADVCPAGCHRLCGGSVLSCGGHRPAVCVTGE